MARIVRAYGVQFLSGPDDDMGWEWAEKGWYWGTLSEIDIDDPMEPHIEGDSFGPFETEDEAVKDMQNILDSIQILVEGAGDGGEGSLG